MIKVIRFTTPTLLLEVDGDLSDMDVYVSLESKDYNADIPIDPEDISVDDAGKTTIHLDLTQEMTGTMPAGSLVKMQINWISSMGVREATSIKTMSITENLYGEVISFGG